MLLSTFYLVLSTFLLQHEAKGLRCFTCIDAPSNEACNKEGRIVECAFNEQSCQNEIRLSEGDKFRITKRCKQPLACENNQVQNDKEAWKPTQCNPQFPMNSVCKCCCANDLCNSVEMPCDNNKTPSCPTLPHLHNGKVKCSNTNFLNSVCRFNCDQGYNLNGAPAVFCMEYPRGLMWNSSFPICKANTCESIKPPLYGGVKCSKSNTVTSDCVFNCNIGYRIEGANRTVCQTNRRWRHQIPICRRITCSAEGTYRILSGITSCSDGNLSGSICSYTCVEGYYRLGSISRVCQNNGQWSGSTASCEPFTCAEEINTITNGAVSCSRFNYYGSTCSFTCDAGYRLEGSSSITCLDDFKWSNSMPTCVRETCSFDLIPPRDGSVVCTEKSFSFSECTYTCGNGGEEWEMFGTEKVICAHSSESNSYEWTNQTTPCCARRCPPYGLVDLFLVLDSSSSVGKENWNKTVYFIKDVLDQFVISKENVLVGAIRYNKFVDTASEIKIGQYQTQKATTEAIINLPYDGSGTLTGKALNYVLNNMLKEAGNRKDVKDLVFVVTDGISKDNASIPAKKLREVGADVVALGIVNKGGSLKREDIVNIVDDPENAILVDSGFEGLSLSVIDLLQKKLCDRKCE